MVHLRSARIATLLAALPLATSAAQSDRAQPAALARTGTLPTALNEVSGVAVSRQYAGVLWTHNDSGDDPLVYAVNLKGEITATFRAAGAAAVDWEDIALGPCPERPPAPCLYIADTGDNIEQRPTVHIYIVPEPTVAPTVPGTSGEQPRPTGPARRLTIRLPDRPHDIEALAVHPGGEVSLVTKGRSGSILRYRIPTPLPANAHIVPAPPDTLLTGITSVADQVTAASYSPNGRLLALRTYAEVIFFEPSARGAPTQFSSRCWIGPRQMQGEALDFLDDTTLVILSEAAFGQPAAMDTAQCPLPRESR